MPCSNTGKASTVTRTVTNLKPPVTVIKTSTVKTCDKPYQGYPVTKTVTVTSKVNLNQYPQAVTKTITYTHTKVPVNPYPVTKTVTSTVTSTTVTVKVNPNPETETVSRCTETLTDVETSTVTFPVTVPGEDMVVTLPPVSIVFIRGGSMWDL